MGLVLVAVLGCGDGHDSNNDNDMTCSTWEIRGRRYDAQHSCLGDPEVLGCVPDNVLCPAAFGFATDEHGQCYLFPNLCLPDGFTLDLGNPCGDWLAPQCGR